MKNILVTGGAGFVGSHLVDALLEQGAAVRVVDNFSSGSRRNLAHQKNNKNLTVIEADISALLPKNLSETKWDVIYNLASPASPVYYQRYPEETLLVGSLGLKNILALCTPQTRFLHTSTSEVYGDPSVHPQPETYWGNVNSYGPRSCYDEAKRFGEAYIYTIRRKHNLNTGIVRIFNTYGPRMDSADGRVISNFITQALAGKPLTIYGDGAQTRSFCYVSDLVRALILMAQSNEEGPINLGNPGEFSINELGGIIQKVVQQVPIERNRPLPADDPKQRQPDIKRAKERLGWEPTVKLEEGLRLTADWYKKELK